MKKYIAFLIVILLLAACAREPQRPPNAEEQLATIAVKTQAAEQLGTIVAQTLTAQPPTPTSAFTATPTEVIGAQAIPTGDAPIVADVIACGPVQQLIYFEIDAAATYRNWEAMLITVNNERVICGEVPGDTSTLVCELPAEMTFPATAAFALGDGIVGSHVINEAQCNSLAFPESLLQVYTVTSAQNVNLRTNPGLLFTVSRVMAQGTRLQVIGLTPGGDWAFVRNNEGITGWVDLTFLRPFPKTQSPMVEPTDDVQLVKGNVVDAEDIPMHGINFSITQGTKRTDARTNASGVFYAYMPTSATGVWTVGFNSIEAGSNALTVECLTDTNACGRTDRLTIDLTLPANEVLLFNWK
jgi:hypothetical protein